MMSLWSSERVEVRHNYYKVVVDTEEGHRRRENNMVDIRKICRKESLLKKHRDCLSPSAAAAASQMAYSSTLQQKRNNLDLLDPPLETLPLLQLATAENEDDTTSKLVEQQPPPSANQAHGHT